MSTPQSPAVPLRTPPATPDRRPGVPALATAAALTTVVAFVVRLVPVLRGGGLHGLGNYDDAVHFAATVGLVHGRLPYRDFLLLQPPGILVLLSPFAALGRLVGDPDAFALARLAWMAVGAVTAGLLGLVLRRHGLVAVLVGGLTYALFFPVSYVERTTLLEGPQNTLLVLAVLLLGVDGGRFGWPAALDRTAPGRWLRRLVPDAGDAGSSTAEGPADPFPPSRLRRAVIAGCALGLVVTIKIWGVVIVMAVVGWLLVGRRSREAAATGLAAMALAAVVYLVFFVQAPTAMWQMVVTDQLGRRSVGTVSGRLAVATGLRGDGGDRVPGVLLGVVLLVVLAALLLALRTALGRLGVALYVVSVLVLLATPSEFLHYGALLGAPTALVLGTAAGTLAGRPAAAPRGRPVLAAVLGVAVLVGLGWHQPDSRFGTRFRITPAVRDAVDRAPGCVTFDDPGPALELDVVQRNLDRGCPLVVDLGGRSYHPPMIRAVPRDRNTLWQAYALDYLRGGDVALISRFRTGGGFSAATRAVVRRWPLLAKSGPVDVRRPPGR